MKRLITFICLIVVLVLGYQLIVNGFEKSSLKIASYKTIEKKSEALTKKLAGYDKKNQEEYETAVSTLNSTIKMYKDSKSKYTEIYEELADVLASEQPEEKPEEIIDDIIYSDKEKYKVDFLFVTLGNYGEKEGVDVIYQLTTSSTTDPNSSTLNYFLADLKFTVTGQYINVANFISDLENDNKLNWEISEFEMAQGNANGYSGVSAKFTVKDVPIDSESYIESKSPTTGGENQSQDPNGTGEGDGTGMPLDSSMSGSSSDVTNTTTMDPSKSSSSNPMDTPNTPMSSPMGDPTNTVN